MVKSFLNDYYRLATIIFLHFETNFASGPTYLGPSLEVTGSFFALKRYAASTGILHQVWNHMVGYRGVQK